MKKLAIFDIDGTVFRWQLYHELVFELARRGIFSQNEAEKLDEALLNWEGKKVSWREYELQVVDTIENHIAKIRPVDLESAAEHVVSKSGHKIYNYTTNLLKGLQSQGYHTLALSASQQEVAEQFASRYNFDDCVAVVYERDGENYTGKRTRIIHGRKDKIIEEYLADKPSLTLEGSIAVGDSDGDIGMLELVSHPIAFNPSKELFDKAIKNNWKIVIERKNIAYTLENRNDTRILAQTDSF